MNFANSDRIALATALLVCSLLSSFIASPADAQVTGATLSGVISDSTGSAVANAKITIKNVATGLLREVDSNTDGFYTAPNLLPGEYEITVSVPGFGSVVQKNITLTVGAEQPVNVTLRVGNVSETVVVSDAPPTIQTTTSMISATVDSNTMRELPLNGRDWTSLATLEPGILSIPTQVGTGLSANKGNRGFGNQLSDSGHRPYENTYRMNGIVINDYSNGAPGGASGVNLGVDGIQEFSVLTTNYTSEYGHTSGAVINAITKSGRNDFHGTAFFFDRDKIFDAKNYFDDPAKPIPPFRRIQFGASGGKSIVKDKTFVYGSYEGLRQNQPLSSEVRVPSHDARLGILCNGPTCATTRTVPIDSGSAKYLPLWQPLPASLDQAGLKTDTVKYVTAAPSVSNENYATVRIDQKISERDNLSGSYFWDSGPQSQPDPLLNETQSVFSRRQMASVEETHMFSSHFLNTVRAGVSRVRGDINLPVSAPNAAAGSASLAVLPGAIATPRLAITGLTPVVGLGGNNQFFHRWNSGQFYDDAFVTRGKHEIKIGFAFERMQYNVTERLSPNGQMRFGTTATILNPFEAFLRNLPTGATATGLQPPPGGATEVGIRESSFAGYVQDDWRARSNLTLNLGLRYEMATKPTEAHNKFQEITTLENCAASPTACLPVPVNSPIANNPTLKNFEPRIGFAWDPHSNGKTAVRGGFGVFDVLPLPYIFGLNTSATFPFQIAGSYPGSKLGTPSDPNSFTKGKIRQRFIEQNPTRSYVLNWNLNIQRELAPSWTLMVGYVGSRSVHLPLSSDDWNIVQPTLTSAGLLWPVGSGTKLDPNVGPIRPVYFDSAASYHGLQTQLRKMISKGFQGQVSYTWGKCRDMGSAPHTGDPYLNTIGVPIYSSKLYRLGACDFDIRHNLVGTFIWGVPGPKSSAGFVNSLLGGWELGTIITRASGAPFTPTIGFGDDPLGTKSDGDFSMDFASRIPGCNPIQGGVNYLNLDCFSLPTAPVSFTAQCRPFAAASTTPPAGTVYCSNLLGNAGRNSLYGPAYTNVDFSIFKNTHIPKISESFNIQFRAEFFNVLNHPNFVAPGFLGSFQNNSIFAANGVRADKLSGANTAGVLNSAFPSRQIQLGLKLVW
ncbi:MAG TPA: TonB-dependent receptor [Candidatus Dormibacteraeota bacterium]|nr:TonB-dependent receptor [Candidatus Dormibacteraeota bacterium]